MERVVVAFSGGVDSVFLAHVCVETLGDRCLGVIVDTPFLPRRELEEAKALAERIGLTIEVARVAELPAEVWANVPERCYLCKRTLMPAVAAHARSGSVVVEGSNADDRNEHRPGMRALAELGVRSPLLEAGLTKAEIRRLSRRAGLPTWDKPAAACLATRVPTGVAIEVEVLEGIEAAEKYLRSTGVRQCRVRAHDGLARIEVAPAERERFFDMDYMDAVGVELRKIGFSYVTLDLQGYRTGSMDLNGSRTRGGS